MSQIEQELGRVLRAPSTPLGPSTVFAERVVSEASRRLRRRQRAERLSIAAFVALIGVAAWVNRPVTAVVVAESVADVPGSQTEEIVAISDRQAGATSWSELSRTLVTDAGPELACSLGVAILVAGAFRSWTRRRHPRTPWWEVLGRALLAVCAVVGAFIAAFDVYWLPSDSMEPTIPQGSRVVVDPRGRGPEVGDVIVVARPAGAVSDGVMAGINRVVGVAGDDVTFDGETLMVNGLRVVGLPPVDSARTIGDEAGWLVPDDAVLLASDRSWQSGDFIVRSVDDIDGIVRWRTP